jgi:hypothetical protein
LYSKFLLKILISIYITKYTKIYKKMVTLDCGSDRVVIVRGTSDPPYNKGECDMADADWSVRDEKALQLEAKALLLEQKALWAYDGNPGKFPQEVQEKINAAWAAYEASL